MFSDPTSDPGGFDGPAGGAMGGEGRLVVGKGTFVPADEERHPGRSLGEAGFLGLALVQLDSFQVGRLGRLGCTDGLGPLSGAGVGVLGELTKLGCVRVVSCGEVGVVVVGGDHLGHLGALVGEDPLKVLGGSQMAGSSLGSGQGVVGDGPDERLGEDVLAALGRELVGPDAQHLFSHKRAQQVIEQGWVDLGDGFDAVAGKARAEDRALLYEQALVLRKAVEAGRDEGRQPRWNVELAELADKVQCTVS